MTVAQLNKYLGNIDLYLLDQILKNKIPGNARVLDAGCGEGRNLIYFLNQGFDVHGVDKNPDAIRMLKFIIQSNYDHYPSQNFLVGELSNMTFLKESFDLIICSAVLHFAKSATHFWDMLSALDSVLAKNGMLFIRMTSDIGLEGHRQHKGELFRLPDGSIRFLITSEIIEDLLVRFNYNKTEPIKTVQVEKQRCMTTLVLKKN